MRLSRFLTFALILTACLLAASSDVAAKDDWVQVKSKNFTLIGNASVKDIRNVGVKLEQFRETFRLLFGSLNLSSPIPTNVVVFKDAAAYRPFKPKRADGKTDADVAGYFQTSEDVNYITLSASGGDRDVYGTIFHEYVHFIIDTNFGKSEVPQWFNEGLAEYYQTFEIADDIRVKLGLPQAGHLQLLQQNQLMPIAKLLAVTNYQLRESGGHSRSIFYAQSWALVHYIIQTGRSGALEKYLKAVTSGTDPAAAFQEVFQTTYSKTEADLRRYVDRGSYNFHQITLKKKLAFDAEMRSSVLTEAESNAYLGDLLYPANREDEAEQFLLAAVKLQPDLTVANTTLGMLRLAQRKFDESRSYLEKATALDPRSTTGLYPYASLLGREGRDEYGYINRIKPETAAKMRDALRKAIAIDPAYTASYELLAFVSMVNNDDLDGAIAYLQTALKYQPGNYQYTLRMAEILTRSAKLDEAAALVEKVVATAEEPEIKARAASLLNQIAEQKDFFARRDIEKKRYDELVAKAGGTEMHVERIEADRAPTEEETARQNEFLRMRALNEVVRKPGAGEQRVLGSVQKIDCKRRPLAYSIKTATDGFTVTSKDFNNLFLRAHDAAAMKVSVGCDANLGSFNALITFKPAEGPKNLVRGELVALEFVPSDFRFMSDEEMRSSKLIIYQQPAVKPKSEVFMVGSISEDIEAKRRVLVQKEVNNALRKPLEGEKRDIGFLENIECVDKDMFFNIRTTTQSLKLVTATPEAVRIIVFTPDVANTPLKCGTKAIEFPVVFTYRDNPDGKKKTSGEIKSLDFVPKSFVLDP